MAGTTKRRLVRDGSHDFADSFPAILVGTARLPRRFAPRNDTSGGAALETVRCTGLALRLPLRGRAGHAPPLHKTHYLTNCNI